MDGDTSLGLYWVQCDASVDLLCSEDLREAVVEMRKVVFKLQRKVRDQQREIQQLQQSLSTERERAHVLSGKVEALTKEASRFREKEKKKRTNSARAAPSREPPSLVLPITAPTNTVIPRPVTPASVPGPPRPRTTSPVFDEPTTPKRATDTEIALAAAFACKSFATVKPPVRQVPIGPMPPPKLQQPGLSKEPLAPKTWDDFAALLAELSTTISQYETERCRVTFDEIATSPFLTARKDSAESKRAQLEDLLVSLNETGAALGHRDLTAQFARAKDELARVTIVRQPLHTPTDWTGAAPAIERTVFLPRLRRPYLHEWRKISNSN
eukprot:TRINITY_DN3240_c0_g1_i1.p1 TRINITY_DN3240_c0_g1~~TRINITY_DN3240_c0_g1_i1.p1  ORF type:complete len:326 (+),score=47.33 TRINITY_DN3240_c0_g1_i1:20-997(+)